MTYNQFYEKVTKGQKPADWRFGQYAFNTLWDEKPDLANQIRGTRADPFYIDERLPIFWNRLAEIWV